MSKKDLFCYVRVEFKLTSPQLGTCTAASIYDEHVIKKAKDQIKEANKQSGKIRKALQKYRGSDDITEAKEISELQGIIRTYHELLGKAEDIPNDLEQLLKYAEQCEKEFELIVKEGEARKATVFMRDEGGMPIISSHMVIGNLKENAKIMTNNSTLEKSSKMFPSKISIQEMLALDVKPVEHYMKPNKDIIRDDKGNPEYCERPIGFPSQKPPYRETAIAVSEQLPIGTEYAVTLRIRADSPFAANDFAITRALLHLGKSNGMGQWRGSGGKGQYVHKLTVVKEPAQQEEFLGWD